MNEVREIVIYTTTRDGRFTQSLRFLLDDQGAWDEDAEAFDVMPALVSSP